MIADYLGRLAGYRKNTYPALDEAVAARLREEWGPFFAEWGYPLP